MARDRGSDIREAAVRLFAQHGYDATSMRHIANEVGLLPGSLYAHIRSKEQLLLEIIEQGIDDFREAVAPVAASREPAPDRLRAAIHAHMQVIAASLDRTGIVFLQWRSLTGAQRSRVLAARREYENLFVQILQEGVHEGTLAPDLDVRSAVLVVLGALNWAPQWLTSHDPMSVDAVADRVADLFLGGLVGSAARPPAG